MSLDDEKETVQSRFSIAQSMSKDVMSANAGVGYAYRDFNAVELFNVEHDYHHAVARRLNQNWDCDGVTQAFWNDLGADVRQRNNPIETATYNVVFAKLMLERQSHDGEVGFVVVEQQRDDESDEEFRARVVQALRDEKDLAAMTAPEQSEPVVPLTEAEVGKFVSDLADFMGSTVSGNSEEGLVMPEGPEDEEESNND